MALCSSQDIAIQARSGAKPLSSCGSLGKSEGSEVREFPVLLQTSKLAWHYNTSTHWRHWIKPSEKQQLTQTLLGSSIFHHSMHLNKWISIVYEDNNLKKYRIANPPVVAGNFWALWSMNQSPDRNIMILRGRKTPQRAITLISLIFTYTGNYSQLLRLLTTLTFRVMLLLACYISNLISDTVQKVIGINQNQNRINLK